MDRQKVGVCCTASYAMSMDRIMLSFRPIAPKPPSADRSLPCGRSGGSAVPDNGGVCVKTGRSKRRRAAKDGCTDCTVNRRNNSSVGRRRIKSSLVNADSGGSFDGGKKEFKTLQLLPEEPVLKKLPEIVSKRSYPSWSSSFGDDGICGGISIPVADRERTEDIPADPVQSLVKVERVTAYWAEIEDGLGCTDEARVMNLRIDTCPGLISDGLNRVRWINAAYRRMVSVEGELAVAACVVMDDGVALPVGCSGFTCRVRVVTCGKEKSGKTVPCDVWRMDCGGFAWRLDTAAALSLGVGH